MNKKQVEIIATVGPSTHSEKLILKLAKAGVDIFRINFAHARPREVAERVRWINSASEKVGKKLYILGDLPGPKIRIGDVEQDTYLEQGQKFTISKKIMKGNKFGCSVNYPSVLDFINEKAEVFINDGKIMLHVDKKFKDSIETTVLAGGHLTPKKGFSGEGISLRGSKLSEKDKKAIKMLVDLNADMIAVSFVETENDVLAVKKLLPKKSNIKLIAKIETINGVRNVKKILQRSDGLMIARGDLGLAVPIANVPHMQKDLIKKCIRRRKFVITATHMLESMVHMPIPTRAEVSDVANAVLDGTHAVMLSAETAEGRFPVETIAMMRGIIDEALKHRSAVRTSYAFNLLTRHGHSLKI